MSGPCDPISSISQGTTIVGLTVPGVEIGACQGKDTLQESWSSRGCETRRTGGATLFVGHSDKLGPLPRSRSGSQATPIRRPR